MRKIIINLSNRWLYTLIGLLVLGVGVFVVNALTPGVAPNPGHLISEVAPPSGCGTNQVLQWTGSSWSCVDISILGPNSVGTLEVVDNTLTASDLAANSVGNSELIDNPSFSSITLGGVSRTSWWTTERQGCYWLDTYNGDNSLYGICPEGYVINGLKSWGGWAIQIYCCQIK